MRKKIEYVHKNPIDNKITKTFIEHFFIGEDINKQILMLFETRIASLNCLISYTDENLIWKNYE